MTEQLAGSISGWPDEQLRATAIANFGLGADVGLPPELRFLMGVVRTLNSRRKQLLGASDGGAEAKREELPTIFFYSPKAPESCDVANLDSSPMLDNGLTALEGNFWFVGPLAHHGFAYPLNGWPDDRDVFDIAIDDLKVGDLPAVLLENRLDPPEVRHYPAGLSNPEDVSVVPLGGEQIDIDRILDAIDRAHTAHLRVPYGPDASRLWKNRRKHLPMKNAEQRVQFILRVALQSAFPATVVREEQPEPAGRLDLEIEESQGDAQVVRHALLELKVLRSYGSTGRPVSAKAIKNAIAEGVKQASTYREQRGTRASALCCFDMRTSYTKQKCFASVKTSAKRRQVHLRVWHIFTSPEEFRAAIP